MIPATETSHDDIEVWCPPGHIIGYVYELVHAGGHFVDAIVNGYRVSRSLSAPAGLLPSEFVNNPDRSKESKAGDLIISIIAGVIGGIEFKGG